MQKEDDWSPNPFWDTLFIILKSADLKFFLFADHLPASLLNQWESVSDLKEICAQSWGHIEAFRHIISPKTSLQQPCSWILIYPITLLLLLLLLLKERVQFLWKHLWHSGYSLWHWLFLMLLTRVLACSSWCVTVEIILKVMLLEGWCQYKRMGHGRSLMTWTASGPGGFGL